ncbi:hypothetical protein CC202_27780, partial [Pseudomonas savastanoi]
VDRSIPKLSTLASSRTRRERLVAEMEKFERWASLLKLIEPFCRLIEGNSPRSKARPSTNASSGKSCAYCVKKAPASPAAMRRWPVLMRKKAR